MGMGKWKWHQPCRFGYPPPQKGGGNQIEQFLLVLGTLLTLTLKIVFVYFFLSVTRVARVKLEKKNFLNIV